MRKSIRLPVTRRTSPAIRSEVLVRTARSGKQTARPLVPSARSHVDVTIEAPRDAGSPQLMTTVRWVVAALRWRASLAPLVVEDAKQARGRRGACADPKLGVDVLEVPSHCRRSGPRSGGSRRPVG